MLLLRVPFFFKLVLLLTLVFTPVVFGNQASALADENPLEVIRSEASDLTEAFSLPRSVPSGMTIKIDGSGNMVPINQALKQQFEEQFPGTEVEIQANGTEPAIKALLNGEIDVAAISRRLTPTETAKGLLEVPLGQKSIAIIVSKGNSFNGSLTIKQFAKIARGEITDWAEVGGQPGTIRFIDRPLTSDTRLALSQYKVLDQALNPSEFGSGEHVVQMATDDTSELVRQLGKDGIGYAIADEVKDRTDIKLVKTAILLDTLPGDALYPYSLSRAYAYKRSPGSEIKSFLGFVTTEPGQAALTTKAASKSTLSNPIAPLLAPILASPVDDISTGAASKPQPGTPPTIKDLGVKTENTAKAKQRVAVQEKAVSTGQQEPTQVATKTAQRSPAKAAAKAARQDKAAAKDSQDQEKGFFWWLLLPLLLLGLFLQWLFRKWRDTVPSARPSGSAGTTTATTATTSRVQETPSSELSAPVTAQTAIDSASAVTVVDTPSEPRVEPTIASPPPPSVSASSALTAVPAQPTREVETAEVQRADYEPIYLEAMQLFNDGQYEATLPLFDRVVVLNPDWFDAWVGKGNALLRLGRTDEAREAFNRANQLRPGDATMVKALADLQASTQAAPGSVEPSSTQSASPVTAATSETPTVVTSPIDSATTVAATTAAATTVEPATVATPTVEPPAVETTEPAIVETSTAIASSVPMAAPSAPEAPTAPALNVAEPSISAPASASDLDLGRFKEAFLQRLATNGNSLETATANDAYLALAKVICDRLLQRNTPETYLSSPDFRMVSELSAEYLPGPHLGNSLVNLGIYNVAQQAMQELGLDLKTLCAQEEEPGLGRGGLGRLMVCYLDALATAEIPAIGYGIRYEYGIFDQEIQDGWQVETRDTWLRYGNPWEVQRPEGMVEVQFGGHTQAYVDEQGDYRVRWLAQEVIQGIPYDTPIPGYKANTVNLLRLWQSNTDNLCKILYPVDVEFHGRELRLKQQFFLISCALQDMIRLHVQAGREVSSLSDRFALQLNDTDTTLAVPELMRLLLDHHGLPWDQAWLITQKTLSYTNHSLMPETLDDLWSIALLQHNLPRHLEIIFEINARFLDDVRSQYPEDSDRLRNMSLIDESGERFVRLTHLACVGVHAVNGVSELHTTLLKQRILTNFYQVYPDQFSNKTNGITPRRFLLLEHPRLAELITRHIGDGWIKNLEVLNRLEGLADDGEFRQQWRQTKLAAKQDLIAHIRQLTGIDVHPNSLFDVQTMVMHEYKRQHLNVLHILTVFNQIKANPNIDIVPRTFIFGGKAAPDYNTAKLIIKLIHSVAQIINNDPDVDGRLKVVFLPDLNIKSAQPINPAVDLSEHISLAGTEACDTGNMIAALNGGLILGSADGSNLEMRDAVGANNFFQFGLTLDEVVNLKIQGYTPMEYYNANSDLKAAIDLLTSGTLSDGDTERFKPLVHLLLSEDKYLLLADYQSYIEAQNRVSQAYRDPEGWTRMSILNTARIGRFSSDRAVREYSQEVWQIKPMTERLRQFSQPQAG
jgi:starch phosphorylase